MSAPLSIASPFTLPASGRTLPNRLAKAAMSEGMASLEGGPTPALIHLYERFARSGVGLQITGNVLVDPRYLERPENVVVEDARHLPALEAYARAAQSCGALVIAQVSHAGRQTNRFVYPEPVAPSAVPAVKVLQSFAKPRALGREEVLDVVERFARTSAVLAQAGFDGVQIHAAHGYLLSQFLSPLTNLRQDEWGGDVRGRAKIVIDIVRRVRAVTKPTFVVALKLNSADFQKGGFGTDEANEVLALLANEGVDLVEISGGNYESPALLFGQGSPREAYFLSFAEQAKRASALPLMLTGGFRTRRAMDEALVSGAVDLIGLARPIAYDPDATSRLLAGTLDTLAALPTPSGKRSWHALAQTAFYGTQMRRLGEGREVSATTSPFWAMLGQVAHDVRVALSRRLRGIPERPRAAYELEAAPDAVGPTS
jgi:2,4-dienoyl-CoA reductase-like NADH-dependent reductase (Old Yellow Enzyme family)